MSALSLFSDMSLASVAPKKDSGIYYFDIRYTLPPRPVSGYSYEDISHDFKEFLLKQEGDKFIFQFECNTPLTGVNTHIQCYLHCKVKQLASTLLNKLKAWDPHPGRPGAMYHVAPASDNGKAALSKYAMKANSRVAGPYADHYVYMGQDLVQSHELYEWQNILVQQAKLPPGKENRVINWLYDEKGCSGKSMIAKYLDYHHDVPTIQFASSRHMMDIISANRYKSMYVFDLTRTKAAEVKMDDLYSVVEQLKNGTLQKTMNKPEKWHQMPARVWVFSNYPPDQKKLSNDRWCIWTISANKLFCTNQK